MASRAWGRVTWSQPFRTRQLADPTGFVRTFGKVLDWADDWADGWTGAEGAPTDHFDPAVVPLSSTSSDFARGKIAVLRVDDGAEAAVCYQVSDSGSHAEIVGCSNASAAALARYADRAGRPEVELVGKLPGGDAVLIEARVHPCPGGVSVLQTWHGLGFAVREESEFAGRRLAVCTGPLNNYLIVHARPTESPAEFALEDAMTLWRAFGFDAAPLLSRMAVVQTADQRGRRSSSSRAARARIRRRPSPVSPSSISRHDHQWIGARIDDPVVDIASMATSLGAVGIGPVTGSAELRRALAEGIAAIRSGRVCVVDVLVDHASYDDPEPISGLGARLVRKARSKRRP